jgi:hypothetical protein
MYHVTDGTLIRYGKAEPGKAIAQQIGRTKPSRAPEPEESRRKKNDGRPPDTSKELLANPKSKSPTKTRSSAKEKMTPTVHDRPSYPWHNNSCWLDTSLELIFITVMRDFPRFSSLNQVLLPEMALRVLFETLELCRTTVEDTPQDQDASSNLRLQRDSFRKFLRTSRITS